MPVSAALNLSTAPFEPWWICVDDPIFPHLHCFALILTFCREGQKRWNRPFRYALIKAFLGRISIVRLYTGGKVESEPLELSGEGFVDGDRGVRGWRHIDGTGRVKWRIRTWLKDGTPVDEYWVMNRKFYEFLPVTDTGAAMGRLIIEMDEEKQKTVLDAVAKWEARITENPCT